MNYFLLLINVTLNKYKAGLVRVYDGESCGVLARPPTVRPTAATTAPATTGRTSLARAPCCAANQTRPVKLFPPRALASSPLQPPRTQSCCSKLGTYKIHPR